MNTARRILIVTNGPLCRNPRVVKEATALGSAGFDVTVLGIRNHSPSVATDTALVRAAPFVHRELNLIGANRPVSERLRIFLLRLRHRIIRDLAAKFGYASIESLGPAHALLKLARQIPSDLVICHNEIPHWIGTRLIAEGRRVAADFEDWHSEDLLPEDRRQRPLALLRRVERTLLRRATAVSTTSNSLAAALHERYGGTLPCVIHNAFPLPYSPREETPVDPSALPSFFWFSQTIGPGRGLELFLSAWVQTTRPSRLALLGQIDDEFRRHLLALLPEAFRSRVTFLPLVPPDELPTVISRHDIGLALEQAFIPNRNLTLTNKILQYLGSGLALVASDTAGQCEVFAHDPSVGVIMPLHETTALARALDALIANPAELRRRQTAARQLAATHYCWELEAPRLVALVSRALSTVSNTCE